MADLNGSIDACQGRKSVLDSTSSNCSVSELHSIFNLTKAIARIERDVQLNQFAGTSQGQCCLKQLRKSVSDKLSSCELLEIQSQRPSVITPTPPGTPKLNRVSTPIAHQTLPIPPGDSSCISFGQDNLHIPPNSPACSNISSIGGEVFQDFDNLEPTVDTISRSFNSSPKMEQAEANLRRKRIEIEHRMRMYTVAQLNNVNVNRHEAVVDKIQDLLTDLVIAIEEHIHEFSSSLGQERVAQLKSEISTLENNVQVYTDSFVSKLTELKTFSNPASLLPSMNNLALSDSFQVQQNAAKKKVKAKLDAIMEDLVKLSKKASKVEDWSAATDLVVERAMKENENLKKEYDRINAVKREVTELMAEFDLDEIRDGLSIQECDLKLDEVEKEVEATVKAVEEQNDTRELYSLDDVKVDKVKLPTFSGKESEDYEKFKSDLLKGFAQNRVTQADKLGKLRECLYGEAKKLVPHSISSNVDDALKVLDQAYGDPIRLFTYRQDYFFKLGKQPKKTDKGGYKAQVEWFRDVEVVMESLLALALKDKICAATLFSPKEMKSYLNSFDTYEFEQLTQCEGLGELQFRNWLFKVGQFREKAQNFAKYKETGSNGPKVNSSSSSNNKSNQKQAQPSLAMFKPQAS